MTYTQLQDVRKTHSMKDLRVIHDKAVLAVEKLKSCEAELILVLQEVDDKLVHRFLGYNSLHQYALQIAVENGELSVSKATRITKIIDDKSQTKWVELAKTLPRAELERQVAAVSPRAVVHERVRFLNSTTLEMSLPISEEGFKEVERARELLSSNLGYAVSLEETVVAIAKFFNKHNDPVAKADRALKRKEKRHAQKHSTQGGGKVQEEQPTNDGSEKYSTHDTQTSSSIVPGQYSSLVQNESKGPNATKDKIIKPSQRISISLRHEVHHRDRGECQERLPDGSICGERKWIDLHHIQPRSMRGKDELENLTTLCKAHHQARH